MNWYQIYLIVMGVLFLFMLGLHLFWEPIKEYYGKAIWLYVAVDALILSTLIEELLKSFHIV